MDAQEARGGLQVVVIGGGEGAVAVGRKSRSRKVSKKSSVFSRLLLSPCPSSLPLACIFASLFPPGNANANAPHSLSIRTRYLYSRYSGGLAAAVKAASTAGVEFSISLEHN